MILMNFIENQRRLNNIIEKAEFFDSSDVLFSIQGLKTFVAESDQPLQGYRISKYLPVWRKTDVVWLYDVFQDDPTNNHLGYFKGRSDGGRELMARKIENIMRIGFTAYRGLALQYQNHTELFMNDFNITDPQKKRRILQIWDPTYC